MPSSFAGKVGTSLGMAVPSFLITGVLSGVAYLFKRTAFSVLITWTILLLLAFVFLGVGAAKL